MFRLATLVGKFIRLPLCRDISQKHMRNFSVTPRKFNFSRHTAVSRTYQPKSLTQHYVNPYPNDLFSLSNASNSHNNKSGQNQSLLHGATLLGLGFVIASCAKKDEDVEDVVQGRIIGRPILNK